MQIAVHNIFELVAFITSLICYRKLKLSKLNWFTFFLGLTVAVEFLGKWLALRYHNNTWLYNIFINIEFVFYLFIYLNHTNRNTFKIVIKYSYLVQDLVVVGNFFYLKSINIFHYYSLISCSIILLVTSFLFLFEKFESNETIKLSEDTMFWISSGIILFYSGDIVDSLFQSYLRDTNISLGGKIFRIINNNLNLILYSFFSIGFIKCKQV